MTKMGHINQDLSIDLGLGAIISIAMHNIISVTSLTSHLKVFLLMLVGVVFNIIVHLECRGFLAEIVSHVDNMDTSHPIALNGNHNSQTRDLQL